MKTLKCIAIAILSVVGLLGLTILLSATVFKEELTEYLTEQERQEQSDIKAYFASELPVEPENFAEDFRSIHEQVVEK
jgi:predicted PurR-regulated permease PerM